MNLQLGDANNFFPLNRRSILRFFFYSREHLPIHVHVENADGSAKFTVSPVSLIENKGLKNKDLRLAESIIEENAENIIKRWEEYFNK